MTGQREGEGVTVKRKERRRRVDSCLGILAYFLCLELREDGGEGGWASYTENSV